MRTTREVNPYPGFGVTLIDTGAGADTGTRPERATVMVLHGGSGPGSVGGIVDHFAETSRVLAPTHPGWSGTPRPDWFTGVERLAATYLSLLEDVGARRAVVIGHSFGGWVASAMAVRDHAGLIGSMVLVDAIGPAFVGHEIRAPQPLPGRGPSPGDIAALRAYTGPVIADPRLRRRLARVQAPTLLIWGEEDTVVPPAFGRLYAAALPIARFETVPGAGHAPMVDDAETTFALMDEFLGRGAE